MTSADWTPFVAPAALLLNAVIIPWAIVAYQKRTGVQMTDQQRAAITGALTTEVGLVQNSLNRGALTIADIVPDHPDIVAAAKAALARVPAAQAKEATPLINATAFIAARVDTTPKSPVISVP